VKPFTIDGTKSRAQLRQRIVVDYIEGILSFGRKITGNIRLIEKGNKLRYEQLEEKTKAASPK
jgi:hypothetical protein